MANPDICKKYLHISDQSEKENLRRDFDMLVCSYLVGWA